METEVAKSSLNLPQNVSQANNCFNQLVKILKKTSISVTVSMSVSLLGLEKLVEFHFSCPCSNENKKLIAGMFTGPAFLVLALTYVFLRVLRHKWCCPCTNTTKMTENVLTAFLCCMIPPVMWFIILLLDGDYIACFKTNWTGVYVYDKQLIRSWCKPPQGTSNERELQENVLNYIHSSQMGGYYMILIFGLLLVGYVGVYDVWATKIYYCRSTKEFKCCGDTESITQSEAVTPNSGGAQTRSKPTSSSTINVSLSKERHPLIKPENEESQSISQSEAATPNCGEDQNTSELAALSPSSVPPSKEESFTERHPETPSVEECHLLSDLGNKEGQSVTHREAATLNSGGDQNTR